MKKYWKAVLNETAKLLVGGLFLYLAIGLYFSPPTIQGERSLGIVIGILTVLALLLFVDMVASVIAIFKNTHALLPKVKQ